MRTLIKRLLLAFGYVIAFLPILVCWLEKMIYDKQCERCYSQCKELVAIVPTIIGQYVRLAFYQASCDSISSDVCFLLGSMVAHRETRIAARVVVGTYSIVGHADIGEEVLIGARVSLLSGKYQHGRPDQRVNGENGDEQYQMITIGKGTWIGEQAVILANVTEGCTIAAGAVVFKDAAISGTYMGNPARKVSLK